MSNQRFTPEFKDEAVRQVIERGYSVVQVSERMGVSAEKVSGTIFDRLGAGPQYKGTEAVKRAYPQRWSQTFSGGKLAGPFDGRDAFPFNCLRPARLV
jgi:hypothetical protein